MFYQVFNFISAIVDYDPFHAVFWVSLVIETFDYHFIEGATIECWGTNANKW
jgi:hypothetical protein